MTLVLDAGALIAYERGNQTVQAFLERASRTGAGIRTTTGAVAQVWRDGARQTLLMRLLRGILEVELTWERARHIGTLSGAAGGRDVIDASVIDAALDGDEILTSDPDDIMALAWHSGKNLIVTSI